MRVVSLRDRDAAQPSHRDGDAERDVETLLPSEKVRKPSPFWSVTSRDDGLVISNAAVISRDDGLAVERGPISFGIVQHEQCAVRLGARPRHPLDVAPFHQVYDEILHGARS